MVVATTTGGIPLQKVTITYTLHLLVLNPLISRSALDSTQFAYLQHNAEAKEGLPLVYPPGYTRQLSDEQ